MTMGEAALNSPDQRKGVVKKRVVTDEMVDRGCVATGWWPDNAGHVAFIRKVLEAALNEPEKPEIVVTREMERAGVFTYSTHMMGTQNDHVAALTAAYCAMRELERELELP